MASPDRNIRILLINRTLPEHVQGGLEHHVKDLAMGLADEGCHVHLLTAPPSDPVRENYREAGVNIHSSNCGDPSRYSLGYLRKIGHRINRICHEIKPDIVHGQEFALGFWSPPKSAPPLVLTVHGTLTSETPLHPDIFPLLGYGQKIRAIMRFGRRLLYSRPWSGHLKKARAILVDSLFTRNELTLRHDIPTSRIHRIPLGTRPGNFNSVDYETAREQLNWTCFQFLTIGRLEWQKGHELAIDALAGLKDYPWAYTIAGTGSYESRLRKRIANAGLNKRIRLAGRVDPETKNLMLSGADLFLWPERTHPAFGLVGLEALKNGTPVLGTRRGGIPELIQKLPESGRFLIERVGVAELREKILYILDNPYITKYIKGFLASQDFGNNAYREMVHSTIQVYDQLLDNSE